MINAPETILTSRLVLRKPVPDDASAIFHEYAQDPEVTRYLTWKPDQTLGEVVAFLDRTATGWQRGSTFTWAILRKDSRQLVGMIDARVDAYMINIGYVLGREHWNKGYATEALRAVLGWADHQTDVFRVWAVCSVGNTASARVLEKAGMIREGILRRWMVFPNISGTPQDCYCYAHVKSGLETETDNPRKE